jgi:hypothetical protein
MLLCAANVTSGPDLVNKVFRPKSDRSGFNPTDSTPNTPWNTLRKQKQIKDQMNRYSYN